MATAATVIDEGHEQGHAGGGTTVVAVSNDFLSMEEEQKREFSRKRTSNRPRGLKKFANKGDISSLCTGILMVSAGIALRHYPNSKILQFVFAAGLFGFAGGVTNWLAIFMLFERIPFLIGSGVIPRQFIVIRETVKETIMETFFDASFLDHYIKDRSANLLRDLDFKQLIKDVLEKPGSDALMTEKLTALAAKPEGLMLNSFASMFGGIEPMVPMLKPMLSSFAGDVADMLRTDFDPTQFISVERVIDEINHVMTDKLELLTPEIVKELMEHVIREHLGWLVVWGNVFGAIIGVISLALGYNS